MPLWRPPRSAPGCAGPRLRTPAPVAAEFALRLREAALRHPGAVATVGDVRIRDGSSNTVPARVRMSADVRAPTSAAFAALTEAAASLAATAARRHRCTVTIEDSWWSAPLDLSDDVRAVIHR